MKIKSTQHRSITELVEAIETDTDLTVQELESIVSDRMGQFVVTECLSFDPWGGDEKPRNSYHQDKIDCQLILNFAGIYLSPQNFTRDRTQAPVIPNEVFQKLVLLVKNESSLSNC